jgi:tetratricopeptide (TPR) repeat protein
VKRLLILIALLGLPLTARADDLADAEKAYAAQKYDAAIAAYERAVAAGRGDESVLYNLGNAYYRAGKLGKAILNYERALRKDADLVDAQYNLTVAREVVADKLGKDTIKGAEARPLWVRAVHAVPLTVLVLAVLLLDLAFFALLIALRYVPTGFLRTGLVVGTIFAGVVGLTFGGLLAGRLWYGANVRESIVVADEVVMRELPDPQSREMPKLHAGLAVEVLRESQGFWRIRLGNNVEGWVPKDSVELLTP